MTALHRFHLDLVMLSADSRGGGVVHCDADGSDVADAVARLRARSTEAFVVLQAIPDGGLPDAIAALAGGNHERAPASDARPATAPDLSMLEGLLDEALDALQAPQSSGGPMLNLAVTAIKGAQERTRKIRWLLEPPAAEGGDA